VHMSALMRSFALKSMDRVGNDRIRIKRSVLTNMINTRAGKHACIQFCAQMDRISVERILEWWNCTQSVATFDKCAKSFCEHRGKVPSSYPALAIAAMSDQIEPSDAAGNATNPDDSDDPQFQ
jgi:hypothetical protein